MNPKRVYNSRSRSRSGVWSVSASQLRSRATSTRSVASSFESRASSACSRSPSRAFFALTCSAPSSNASRLPHSRISFAAPFSPMPFTPGMLSLGSPTSERTSSSIAGGTPNRSSTASASMRRPFIVSRSTTSGPTSCIRSLSVETIPICAPAGAVSTRVAITSSASKFGTSSRGTPNASQSSRTIGNWTVRSSGCASRPALYSA